MKQSVEATYIGWIQITRGKTTDQSDINNEAKKFYEELHTSESSVETEINHFLDQPDFPVISEQEIEDLDRPIWVKEIEQAITQMRSGKVLGQDAFPIEFYKNIYRNWPQSSKILTETFE